MMDISTFEQLHKVCETLKNQFQPQTVFALHGNLGSGKTTFVQHFMQLLNYSNEVNSPTYSLVNEYETDLFHCFHYDLYRLNDIGEAYDIGIEDYFEQGDYHFIEWPEIIEDILPLNTVHLYFEHHNFNRTLTVKEE